MIVSIIGAHKTGKTTLFEELSILYPEFRLIGEFALDMISNTDTFFKYMSVQEQILKQQLNAQETSENIITDRGIVDNLAYMLAGRDTFFNYSFPFGIKNCIDILKGVSPITREAFKRMNESDILLYIPIEYRYGDPTKEQIDYQELIDFIIKYLLKTNNINYHTITGNIYERTVQALKIILEEQNEVR